MEEKKPNGQVEETLDPNDFDETDDTQKETDNPDEEESKSKEPSESKSDEELEKEKKAKKDSHYAELRRKKEAEEKARINAEREARENKIREEATLQAELGIMKRNPYTDEPIEDEEDLKIYKLQKELEEEGKDPITDLPKKIAENNRKVRKEAEAKKVQQETAQAEEQKRFDAEYNELIKKYPEVNVDELAKDPVFLEVIKGKYGRWTQLEMYEAYLVAKAKVKDTESKDKIDKAVSEKSTKMSKTPSSSANGKATSKSVLDMSAEEFKEYWANKYGS